MKPEIKIPLGRAKGLEQGFSGGSGQLLVMYLLELKPSKDTCPYSCITDLEGRVMEGHGKIMIGLQNFKHLLEA